MPSTWKTYGVDANDDGVKDPYNPVDAIFAAARYLKAAGAEQGHPRARSSPTTTPTGTSTPCCCARGSSAACPPTSSARSPASPQGHFPVARQGDATPTTLAERKAAKRVEARQRRRRRSSRARTRARRSTSSPRAARRWSPSTTAGRQDRRQRAARPLRRAPGRLRQPLHLRAAWPRSPQRYPVPKPQQVDRRPSTSELELPKDDPKPTAPASAHDGAPRASAAPPQAARSRAAARQPRAARRRAAAKERLFANPSAPGRRTPAAREQLSSAPARDRRRRDLRRLLRARSRPRRATDVELKRAASSGSQVIGGTILGRIGKRRREHRAPHLRFEIRPAGRGAPRIDPKPILDGWKLLESTAIYRAAGKNPFFGAGRDDPVDRPDPADEQGGAAASACSPTRASRSTSAAASDIRAGQIDRRVLATLEFLAASGLKPTVTLAEVRPLLPDRLGQRLRALVGQRGRHRRDQRHPDPRPPGHGLDHRHHDPPPADAPGHDEAAPDHLADDLRGRRQHARAGRPRRPHPRRLPAAVRREREARRAAQRGPQAQPVDQADRPPRRDRQPDRAASSRRSTRSTVTSGRRRATRRSAQPTARRSSASSS